MDATSQRIPTRPRRRTSHFSSEALRKVIRLTEATQRVFSTDPEIEADRRWLAQVAFSERYGDG
jgi:hypothetical protein